MADKQDESNTRNGAADGGGQSGTELQQPGDAKLAFAKNIVLSPVLSEKKDGGDAHFVELAAHTAVETSGILEYWSSTKEGTELLEKDYQIVTNDKLILGRNVLTSFAESAAIEAGTAEFAAVSAEFVNAVPSETTTIIYVQPDGSFVEGTGLTAEEQQQLVEHLSKQQLEAPQSEADAGVSEPAQQQQQQGAAPARPGHSGPLAPSELQQVIQQVTSRSQKTSTSLLVHAEQNVAAQRQDPGTAVCEQPAGRFPLEAAGPLCAAGSQGQPGSVSVQSVQPQQPQPLTIMQNASQQLQNAAKQVALQQQSQSQNGTRLKKLETIQIQVQMPQAQEVKERPIAPLTVFQQKNVSVNQLPNRVNVSTGVNVTCPQIIHIAPVVGEHQYLLHNAGDPPIQLLVQRPEPIMGNFIPVLQKIPLQNPINGNAVKSTTTSSSNVTLTSTVEKKDRQKEKKHSKRPQKIKTRSGRVSRPPKYKVKDYKFIKREDLADGHQSDSDDYSEISMEEEEGEETNSNIATMNLNLNPKAFKCETCDKAYIGNGGLSRHYRLNPSHKVVPSIQGNVAVQLEQQGTVSETGSAMLPLGNSDTRVTPGQAAVEKVFVCTTQIQSSPEAVSTTDSTAGLAQQDEQKVEPLHVEGTHLGSEQRESCGPGRPKGPGRPGRPKIGARAGRRGRPGRPPKHCGGTSMDQQNQRKKALLKEVMEKCSNEELIEMVLPRLAKVMTVWEFLLMKVDKGCSSTPQFSDVYQEFEQLHSQVKKMAQSHYSMPGPHTPLEVNDPQVSLSLGIKDSVIIPKLLCSDPGNQKTEDVSKEISPPSKKAHHSEEFKTLPPAKRFKLENTSVESNDMEFVPRGHQQALLESKSHLSIIDLQPSSKTQTHTEAVALKSQVVFSSIETNFTPVDLVEEHLPSEESANAEDIHKLVIDGVPQICSEVSEKSETATEMETSNVLNDSDIADQMNQLEQVLNTDVVPLDHSYRTSVQEPQPPTETVNGLEQERSLESTISLGGTVEFQVGEESQKNDFDQVFFHTEDGLIVHHTGESLAADPIVIVTNPNGTMHIRAPEGVAMETVQALLGIETEGHTEGILVSETPH
ncbi:zinc finger protein 839 isoform X2 [Scleropages formosus]|uniref:zinc finger protein 839 isoform X2 n=1 Tax=Scleropages formosus TaxID=113540 RepID=UPI0010FABB7A|nr:zinc finger protein 839 isoform X2 [Scleropages formosus]